MTPEDDDVITPGCLMMWDKFPFHGIFHLVLSVAEFEREREYSDSLIIRAGNVSTRVVNYYYTSFSLEHMRKICNVLCP